MNAQSLTMEHPAISPMHGTGRHVLLAVTLVIVTFSMLLCLCIFFAYDAPLLCMTHLFAAMTSLLVTSISALTWCITGGIAILLWIALFLCAKQNRAAQATNTLHLSPVLFSASNHPLASATNPVSTASAVAMQRRTRELFFSQPVTTAMYPSASGKQAQTAWEANFAREIEAKHYAVRMRQRTREMRLHIYAPDNKSKGQEYQMKRAGTRNFYKKAQHDAAKNKHMSVDKPQLFDEIYWWSTLSGEQEQGLRSTEGLEKIVIGSGAYL